MFTGSSNLFNQECQRKACAGSRRLLCESQMNLEAPSRNNKTLFRGQLFPTVTIGADIANL